MNEVIRFWGLVLLIAGVLIGLSIILMKKFRKSVMCKYIPTLLIWLLSIIIFIVAMFFNNSDSMRDLGYLLMAMITGIATLIALVITMIIDITSRKKKHKK